MVKVAMEEMNYAFWANEETREQICEMTGFERVSSGCVEDDWFENLVDCSEASYSSQIWSER